MASFTSPFVIKLVLQISRMAVLTWSAKVPEAAEIASEATVPKCRRADILRARRRWRAFLSGGAHQLPSAARQSMTQQRETASQNGLQAPGRADVRAATLFPGLGA
ncbi:hypothetical protein PSPO01_02917 [Paraphaeosphaeria sporulosa]